MESIIWGVVASLIASAICFFISQLYKVNAKKRIDFCIDNAILAFYAFEKAIGYGYYDLAITQVDVILGEINNINQNIYPLTYLKTKKRLFYTFMNNASRFMSIVKNVEMGYSEEDEKQGRCQRIQRYLSEKSDENESWILLDLKTMQSLNNTRNLRKALLKGKNAKGNQLVQLYEKLVEVNSFDTGGYVNKFDLRAYGYSEEKYLKKIRKILKKERRFFRHLRSC